MIYSLNVNIIATVSVKKMKTIGKVELIINEQFLLISSDEKLSINQVVVVFTPLKNEEIKKKYALDYIGIPKGHINIVDKESENMYLAEVFQQSQEKKKVITQPSAFDQLTAGALIKLFEHPKEEIIDLAPGKWSGILDKESSLNIKIKKEITVGDLVGLP